MIKWRQFSQKRVLIWRMKQLGESMKNKNKDSDTSGSAYSNQSYVDLSNTSGMSSQRPVHKRGPYKTKNKSKMEYSISHQLYQKKSGKKSVLIDDWIEGEDDIPDKRTGGPKRAPRTMQAMQEQYPEVVNSETRKLLYLHVSFKQVCKGI